MNGTRGRPPSLHSTVEETGIEMMATAREMAQQSLQLYRAGRELVRVARRPADAEAAG